MPDKTLAWAIEEIEAAMAKARADRDAYAAILDDPTSRRPSLSHASRMWRLRTGAEHAYIDALAILSQVDA